MAQQTIHNSEIGRYIDIKSDFGFKFLFGSEPNKDILIEFLNDLFEGKKIIKDIKLRATEEIGDDEGTKRVIYDLRCTGKDGEEFLVELQRAKQQYFKDRIVYYISRLISRLLRKGKRHKSYELPEVYIICIVDFRIDAKVNDRYFRRVALTDLDSKDVFYNKLFINWFEIPNFVKQDEEIVTNLDKWMWLFKNLDKAEKMPLFMDKRIFKKIFQIAEVAKLKPEDRMAYEASIKAKMDWDSAIAYVKHEATEEAVRKERAKADKEIAILQAKAAQAIAAQQKAEAEKQKAYADKLDTARFIKELGVLTNQQIADKFHLPLEVVEKL